MYLDYDESNILANALCGQAKKFKDQVTMAIFPNALSFYPAARVLNDAGLSAGAQNVYWVDKGGYTGEISAQMYRAAGATYALVGHSERRHLFKETNHEVREKMEAILSADLIPVLCVGETAKERQDDETEKAVEIQLRAALEDLKWPAKRELIIAYEPVWAIGTGTACDPNEAEKTHRFIYKSALELLKMEPAVLYGGSVRPGNVADYLQRPHIRGVLVGGASAKLESWLDIVNAALTLTK